MDKLTVFAVVVLFGVLRGLLQRRQVKAELDERMTKAKSRPLTLRLSGKLQTDDDDQKVTRDNLNSGDRESA